MLLYMNRCAQAPLGLLGLSLILGGVVTHLGSGLETMEWKCLDNS